MSRNVNISPLFNSLKIFTNDGNYFWVKPNGDLTSTIQNLVLYNKNNISITNENDINIKSKNQSIKLETESQNIILSSASDLQINTTNLNISSDISTINTNEYRFNSEKILFNVGLNSSPSLNDGDFLINCNSNLNLDSHDISITAQDLLLIQAKDLTNNPNITPKIEIGDSNGLNIVNDNVILGYDIIQPGTTEQYILPYDKKFNISLYDSISYNDGLYITSYGNVNPEISIKNVEIYTDPDTLLPSTFVKSNILLGSDQQKSYLDVDSVGSFNIIKNKSNLMDFSSLNGITIGDAENINSNISDLDIIKNSGTVLDNDINLTYNYYDVKYISFNDTYRYTIYSVLDYDGSVYKIKLIGRSFIDNFYQNVDIIVDTIDHDPTLISNINIEYFKPTINYIYDETLNIYVILVAWKDFISSSTTSSSYHIKSKCYILEPLSTSISINNVDIFGNLVVDNEIILSNSTSSYNYDSLFNLSQLNLELDSQNVEFSLTTIDEYFILTFMGKHDYIATRIIKYVPNSNNDGSFLVYDGVPFNKQANKVYSLPNNLQLNIINNELYFVQTIKIIENNLDNLYYRYGKFNLSTQILNINNNFSILNFNWGTSNYNYKIFKYSICKPDFDNINLNFFISFYSQYNSIILDSEKQPGTYQRLYLDSDPNYSVEISNIDINTNEIFVTNNVYTNESLLTINI